MQHVRSTFKVTAFEPAAEYASSIETGLPVGVAIISKVFSGEIEGASSTLFTAAFDQAAGVGTYVALESFSGTVAGRAGTFNFAHMASTESEIRTDHHLTIVPASGTGELAGIRGSGSLEIDADGTHHLLLDIDFG